MSTKNTLLLWLRDWRIALKLLHITEPTLSMDEKAKRAARAADLAEAKRLNPRKARLEERQTTLDFGKGKAS